MKPQWSKSENLTWIQYYYLIYGTHILSIIPMVFFIALIFIWFRIMHVIGWCPFSPLLIWNISMAFISSPWHFGNMRASYFVDSPLVWVIWGFLLIRFRTISLARVPQKCCPSHYTCQLVPLPVMLTLISSPVFSFMMDKYLWRDHLKLYLKIPFLITHSTTNSCIYV